jgi:hypothetical protein
MIFAPPASSIAVFIQSHVPAGTPIPGDPVNLAILIVSVLAILVAVTIAIWQRHDLRLYRQADHALEAQITARERLQQERRSRRESWEPVFTEIQDLLIKLEDMESEARDVGHFTKNSVERNELGRIQRRLENVSMRCPDSLHDPLQIVASAATSFRRIALFSNAAASCEYSAALENFGQNSLIKEHEGCALCTKNIELYKTAVILHHAIGKAWEAIHTERGGESLWL